MPFGYTGQNQTKQKVKNSGVLSSFEISHLQSLGQASGSLELIASATASSSTISFTNKFAGYDVHKVVLTNCVPTGQTEFGIRFSNDGGSSYESSNYHFANHRLGSFGERKSTSQATIRLGGDVTTDSEVGLNGYFYIYNANNSAKYTHVVSQFTFMQSGTALGEYGGGTYVVAETVNGVRIGEGTGNGVFTSGTAKLFGVKQ
jgi:hypothetical protein